MYNGKVGNEQTDNEPNEVPFATCLKRSTLDVSLDSGCVVDPDDTETKCVITSF